jgi:phosphate transport system permease protein
MFRACLAAMLVVAALGVPGAAAADDRPTLKVDPATQSVAAGEEFSVNVVQSASTPTTGAQVHLVFDPKILHVKAFELGPAYTSTSAVFAFGNADSGTNGNVDAAVEYANTSGILENVAGFLLPGSGTIPAGDTVFLKVTFVAQGGEGDDNSALSLQRGSMIGENGEAIDPKLVGGTVAVAAGTGPVASGGPSETPTEKPSQPVSPTAPVAVFVAPTTITLQAGMPARLFLVANADGEVSSVAADLTFDVTKLEITGAEAGSAWKDATLIASSGSSKGLEGAIAEANTTGKLQQAGAFYAPGTADLPSGEGVFISVLVQAKVDGTSSLSVGNATVIGVSGETIEATVDVTSLTKAPDKGFQIDPVVLGSLIVLLVVVVASFALVHSGRIPVQVRRRWPYYLSMLLGLIPVLLFTTMVVSLIVNAAPIVINPGIGALFGGEFLDAKGNVVTGYQILPPLWATFLITLIAMAVALPVSLVLAITAVDFPMGPIGRLVRPVIGVLSGVPPIVYAVSVPGFVAALMIPKFAANMVYDEFAQNGPASIGADPSAWPPANVPFNAGAYPWDWLGGNSALLGGLIVGLFLIPFLTPLFVDALRDVPRAAREASLALGANRTYTMRRVVLPRALPAIGSAATLAVLKAMGDAVIVLFAVGTGALMPSPPFDVLERNAGIGAWGASLIGSFDVLDATCNPQQCAVGYTSALVLLVIAAILVLGMTYLRSPGRRGGIRPARGSWRMLEGRSANG